MGTSCPLCGSSNLSEPQPIVTGGAEELRALGIEVPMIQQCECCTRTGTPESFVTGSPEWEMQHKLALSGRVTVKLATRGKVW